MAARRYLKFDEGETGKDIAKKSMTTEKTKVKRQKIDKKNAQKLNDDQLYEKMGLEPIKTPVKDVSYSDIFNKSYPRIESSTQHKSLNHTNASLDLFNDSILSNISRKSSEKSQNITNISFTTQPSRSPTKWEIEKKLLIDSYEEKNLSQQKIIILHAEKIRCQQKIIDAQAAKLSDLQDNLNALSKLNIQYQQANSKQTVEKPPIINLGTIDPKMANYLFEIIDVSLYILL